MSPVRSKQSNLCKLQIILRWIRDSRVNHARFLGTWLDDKLSWDTHVSKLMAKLKCGIGMLQRSKTLLNSSAKQLLYFGQIHSNLCYCLGVWGSMLSKKQNKNLARLQRTAISLIDPTMSIDEITKKYRILGLEKLVRLEQMKIGYKLCHNLLPTNVAVQIKHDHKGQNMSKEHKYQVRNKYIPNLPQVHKNKYKSSFLFCAIREYSVLKSELKRSPTLKSFVCRSKKYLLLE